MASPVPVPPGAPPLQGEPDPPPASPAGLAAENARLRARVRELESRQGLEAVLDHFADSSAGWFWEMDENLRFRWFSSSVERLTGIPAGWHYGKTREEVGTPTSVSAEAWRAHLDTLERREPFRDFVLRRDEPGGERWMRTSGTPFFDDEGGFRGYRGVATDITAEVQARNTARRLLDAVEDLDELFALWDADDRLVMCNRRFREINAAVPHTLERGVRFEEHIRAALDAGLYPQAQGREEEWLEERFEQHRNPDAPVELERQDDRWLLISELRLEDGSTATISTDITDRKRGERVVESKNRLLETVLQTIPDGVQVLDADLELVAWNENLWEVLELDGAAITTAASAGKAFRYALASRGEYGDGDVDELVASREAIARTPVPVQYERALVSGKWMECRGTPVPGGGYLAIYRDVDERKRMEAKLERLATQDELTGLENRRSVLHRLSEELGRFGRYDRPLSLVMVDVDHFKQVNDRHGHAAGDALLRRIGETMRAVFRDSDALGRVGGEEFIAVLPETNLGQACAVAERLRRAVEDLVVSDGNAELHATLSIGITPACHGRDLHETLRAADEALYEAKHTVRNRISVHSGR